MLVRRSLRSSLLLATMLAASPAIAAPPIAYSVGKDVFLTSPTGAATVKVWSGPGKIVVSGLDFDPSSNRIAALGTDRMLRIVSYSDAGVGLSTESIPTNDCIINGFDFHPSDGSLLVSRWCSASNSLEVLRYSGGSYSSPLITFGDPQTNATREIRWVPDGTGFFIGHANLAGSAIERHSIAIPSSTVTVWSDTRGDLPAFDVGRCAGGILTDACSRIILSRGAEIGSFSYNGFGGSEPVTAVNPGVFGHYSPDNSEIVYKWQLRNNYQLKIAGASPRIIVSKGDVGASDWRP